MPRLPSRWRPLAWLLALAAGLLAAGCGSAEAPAPDVVLITLDTTRADRLGVYGCERPNSPNLDAFAREAVVYERAWSTAPWTLPAHASLLTGKHPTSHGAHLDAARGNVNLGQAFDDPSLADLLADRLGDEQTTLAELLAARGYATAAFAGGPWLSPPFGLLQGYEVRDADVRGLNGRSAESLTDAASAWLASVPAGRPLHMLINYFDPHAPYEPPDAYLPPASDYDIEASELPDAKQHPLQALAAAGGERLRRGALRRYDGELRYMDHHLGRLFDALRRAGRYHDALIVVTADHGELFGEHGQYMHGNWHYEELLRVPLIVHWPRARGGGMRVETPVSLVDLLPMIADALALELPAGVEGALPGQRGWLLAESFPDARSVSLYGEDFDRKLDTTIHWPWKLTVSSRGSRELYRLDRDPHEAHDLAGFDPGRTAELAAGLESEREALAPPAHRTTPEGVSSETVESLRALGYVE